MALPISTTSSARETEILSQSQPEAVRNGRIPRQRADSGPGRAIVRSLALKVQLDWKREEDRALYSRLRDLGWMAAHYRNQQSQAKWAELRGWRQQDQDQDKVSKDIRQTEKRELSGDAYSCAEQEVNAAWSRDAKKILAGQPVPQWKPTAALCVSGNEKKAASGVRVEVEGGQYVVYLRAQATLPGVSGSGWLRLPIVPHTKRDEWQGPLLDQFVSWEIPVKKATVHIEPHAITVRLAYRLRLPALPPLGERVATLGPMQIVQPGVHRLVLRTETQEKDYSAELALIRERKDSWDLIRRRVLKQIGRRHGHARRKRERLARLSWDDWLKTHLHTWSRRIVDWCATQGVGTIRVIGIATGDWPADTFRFQLKYKAEEAGIAVTEDAIDLAEESTERTAKALVARRSKKVKRTAEAIRELKHQLEG